jgi:4a-hydroxytetrahydrobiopterin dehydratase
MVDQLDPEEIESHRPSSWQVEDDELVRVFEFDSYMAGVGFAAGAAGLAEEAFHHPSITIDWREVEVRLTTHDAGGLTEKDTTLAARMNQLVD